MSVMLVSVEIRWQALLHGCEILSGQFSMESRKSLI